MGHPEVFSGQMKYLFMFVISKVYGIHAVPVIVMHLEVELTLMTWAVVIILSLTSRNM